MKVIRLFRICTLFFMLAVSAPAFAGPATDDPTTKEAARAQQLIQRLHEIKTMTRNDLTVTEKKDLRKEVKEIRKELKASKNGIYLSFGAIIIILLLLIILL